MWGALSDERTGLSSIIAAGPHQASHSSVRVPRNSWSYFPVSYSRLVPPNKFLNYWSSLYSPGTERRENVTSVIACSVVAGETTCPQSCSLTMALVLSPVYVAVTWKWVYMSRYKETGKLRESVKKQRAKETKILQGRYPNTVVSRCILHRAAVLRKPALGATFI
jgi:hypothetical protein